MNKRIRTILSAGLITVIASSNLLVANASSKNIISENNTGSISKSNDDFSSYQQEVLRLVNVERTKRGLKPLTLNTKLSNVATLKSQDMINKNYFSHTSPTYGSPFDMMKQFGISYTAAAENIAKGQKTPAQVVNAWMNSSGHRANILNANYTELGVGVAKSSNGTIYWTQMFIKPSGNSSSNTVKPGQDESINNGNSNSNTGTNKPSDSNTNNNNSNNNTDTNKPSQDENTSNNDFSAYQQEVLRLVNVERTKRGLKALTLNIKLSNVATLKSQDMINKNYFSHTSPTYGSPFNMMKQFGISYTAAAENIAKGQKTPAEVVNAWMNSSGHRANILNANYTDLGVGIAKSSNGTMYWTQMFIG